MAEMKMEEFENKVNLYELPKPIKMFLSLFLINMGLGYLLAVLTVMVVEGLGYNGIVAHYRGDEANGIFPPELKELAQHAHTHMLSMAMMFFTMGLPFLFTKTLPKWLKKLVLADGFVAVIIATSAFFLIRYVWPPFAVLMIISGMLFGICAFFMTLTPMYEMWFGTNVPWKKK